MNPRVDPGLFDNAVTLPDAVARGRYARLIGLDDHKLRLSRMLGLLVNKEQFEKWVAKFHPDAAALSGAVLHRPPLVVLAGDVGCGKTELAETVGDAVARSEDIEITLLPLSLASRGKGLVGEMTQLLSASFDYTISEARKLVSGAKARGAIILLIDEADALAQSREASQMHHEDRAGVNALIRGIDRIANAKLPAAVIMCTNRLQALDPAIKRRAADILIFQRPDDGQRREILSLLLSGTSFTGKQINALVSATGPTRRRPYGFTYSDITQRLVPAIVLDAFPDKPISPARAIEIAQEIVATPPFQEDSK